MHWDSSGKKGKQTQIKIQQLNRLPVTRALKGKQERLGQVLPRSLGCAAQPRSDLTVRSGSSLHLARRPVLDPISPSNWLWPNIRTAHVNNLLRKFSCSVEPRAGPPPGYSKQAVSPAYTALCQFMLALLGEMEAQFCSRCNQLSMILLYFSSEKLKLLSVGSAVVMSPCLMS